MVMHEYYMKDVASKAVLNARSAVPHSMKRVDAGSLEGPSEL